MLCQKILRANEGQDDISTSDPWNPWNLVDSQLTWWIFQNLASSNIRTTRRGRISFMPCDWAGLPLQPARKLTQKLARTGQFQRDCKEFTNITLWHQLLQPLSLTPVLKNQHCASILQPHTWSYLRMLDYFRFSFRLCWILLDHCNLPFHPVCISRIRVIIDTGYRCPLRSLQARCYVPPLQLPLCLICCTFQPWSSQWTVTMDRSHDQKKGLGMVGRCFQEVLKPI
jgi:hypothetical protein